MRQLGHQRAPALQPAVHHRFGLPIGPVRAVIEISVLALGWVLGGPVGLGTVLYALGIGPIVHLVLPWVTIPIRAGERPDAIPESAVGAPRDV